MTQFQNNTTQCPVCHGARRVTHWIAQDESETHPCPNCGPNDELVKAIKSELQNARRKFPEPLNSAHEGYAVLQEEVDELWDEVKMKKELRSKARMREECIQIAAMAIKFIEDLT